MTIESEDVVKFLGNLKDGQLRIFNMYKDEFDKWEKEQVGDEGWWKSDTSDILFSAFMQMTNKAGMEIDDALNILSNLVSAMRSEYGE